MPRHHVKGRQIRDRRIYKRSRTAVYAIFDVNSYPLPLHYSFFFFSMSNPFYRLPQFILIKIYEYDGTYKDILKKEIGKELWQRRWFLWHSNNQKIYDFEHAFAERRLFIVRGLAFADCIYDTLQNAPLFYPENVNIFYEPNVLIRGCFIFMAQYRKDNSHTLQNLQVHVYDRDQNTSQETKKACFCDERRSMFVYLDDEVNYIWQ